MTALLLDTSWLFQRYNYNCTQWQIQHRIREFMMLSEQDLYILNLVYLIMSSDIIKSVVTVNVNFKDYPCILLNNNNLVDLDHRI